MDAFSTVARVNRRQNAIENWLLPTTTRLEARSRDHIFGHIIDGRVAESFANNVST